MKEKTITICGCRSRAFVEKDTVVGVAARLRAAGFRVNMVDDLCRMVADESEQVGEAARGTIVACHERVVTTFLHKLGVEAGEVVSVRDKTVEAVLAAFKIADALPKTAQGYMEALQELEALPAFEGRDAWYPVIDKTRCTDCGKCHDFCLFGVYSLEGEEVLVANPKGCKTDCPACARMCPSLAIMFPKYDKSPINGGTVVEEEFTEEDREAMYQKRLQYRLQQNRSRFSMLKKDE